MIRLIGSPSLAIDTGLKAVGLLCLSRDGRFAAVHGEGKASVIDLAAGEVVSRIDRRAGTCSDIGLIAGGARLLLMRDGEVCLHDAANGRLLAEIEGRLLLRLSDDRFFLVAPPFHCDAELWDAAEGLCASRLLCGWEGGIARAFELGDRRLLLASGTGSGWVGSRPERPGQAVLFDTTSWDKAGEINRDVRFLHPDGHTAFVTTEPFEERAMNVIDLDDPALPDARLPLRPEALMNSCRQFTADGRLIELEAHARKLHVFAGVPWHEQRVIENVFDAAPARYGGRVIKGLADGPTVVAMGTDEPALRLWNIDDATSIELAPAPSPAERGYAYEFFSHPAGVVGMGADGLRLWDPETGALLDAWAAESSAIQAQSTPDGAIVCGCFDGTLVVFGSRPAAVHRPAPTATRGSEPEPAPHDGPVTALCCLPGGSRAVTLGADGRLQLYDWGEGRFLAVYGPARRTYTDIRIAADGARLVARRAGLVRIWNSESADLLFEAEAELISIFPDGRRAIFEHTGPLFETRYGVHDLSTGARLGSIDLGKAKAQADYHPYMEDMTDEEIDLHTPDASISEVLFYGTDGVAIVTDQPAAHLFGADDLEPRGVIYRAVKAVLPNGGTGLASAHRYPALYAFPLDPKAKDEVLLDRAVGLYGTGAIAFLPDGPVLTQNPDDQTLCLWRTEDWALDHRIPRVKGGDLLVFAGGRRVAVTDRYDDPVPRVWDLADGQRKRLSSPHDGGARSVGQLRNHPLGLLAAGKRWLGVWDGDDLSLRLAVHTEADITALDIAESGDILLGLADGAIRVEKPG